MSKEDPHLDLSILILTMNEALNLAALLPQIDAAAQTLGLNYEIVIIEGGSLNGTMNTAMASSKARVLSQTRPGYGGALAEGLASAGGDFILTMDADCSHDPSFLATFWKARNEADVVIGSRYVPGGAADMPLLRKLLSRILNLFFRYGLSMPWRDLSSGFRLYRATSVKKIQLQSSNFDVLQEILVMSRANGSNITEVPIRYKPRRSGSSHARLLRFGIAYLKTFGRLWRLRKSIRNAHERIV